MNRDISTAEEAFAVLASRLRLQILQALAAEPNGTPSSFTDLYEVVETSNSSQFSYHLSELTNQYVQHTDEGYIISDAGRRIVQMVKAGEYTLQPQFDPVKVSTCCPYCEASSAEATYDGQLATVDCLSCNSTLLRYDLRPAHVEDRNSLEALKAIDLQMRAEYRSALAGVCQRCGGSIQSELVTGSDIRPAMALLVCDCRQCGSTLSSPVKIAFLHRPELISRYWDGDINELTAPMWELFTLVSAWDIDVTIEESVAVLDTEFGQFEVDTAHCVSFQKLDCEPAPASQSSP